MLRHQERLPNAVIPAWVVPRNATDNVAQYIRGLSRELFALSVMILGLVPLSKIVVYKFFLFCVCLKINLFGARKNCL